MSLQPPYSLDKMPKVILDKIVEKTRTDTRMVLRKSCKTFHELTDKKYHFIKQIYFRPSPDVVELRISTENHDQLEIIYIKDSSDCEVQFEMTDRMGLTINPRRTKIIKDADYLTTALSDFATFVNNPQCFVEHLSLSNWHDETCVVPFMQTMTSMKTKLSVQKLILASKVPENFVLEVLPFFKPGTLNEIIVDTGDLEYGERLMEVEQWRLAKKADVYGNVPISQFLHFNNAGTRVKSFSLEDIKLMTETAIQRIEDFKIFTVNSYEFADISPYLQETFPITAKKEETRYKTVFEPNVYLKVFFNNWCLRIQKTSDVE